MLLHLAGMALLLTAGFILRAAGLRILGNLLIGAAAIWLASEIFGELTNRIGT